MKVKLFPFKEKGLYGYFNPKGEIVIKPQFSKARNFKEERAVVGKNHLEYYIDTTGKLINDKGFYIAHNFSDGMAAVEEKGKFGFIDKTGKMVIKPQFKKVGHFSEGLAPVMVQLKHKKTKRLFPFWGFINKQGKFVIKPRYRNANSFSEGLALVYDPVKGTAGFINKQGKYIIKPQFMDGGNFNCGMAPVRIRISEIKLVPQPKFFEWRYRHFNPQRNIDWAELSTDNGPVFLVYRYREDGKILSVAYMKTKSEKNIKWGYIDKTGKWAIPPQYNRVMGFSESIAHVLVDKGRDKRSVSAYIDKNGETILELTQKGRFHDSKNCKEGLIPIPLKNGYGYFDKNGKLIIKDQYYSAVSFIDGLGRVQQEKHGPYSYIDKRGKQKWPLKNP